MSRYLLRKPLELPIGVQSGLNRQFPHDLVETSSLQLWICLGENLHEFRKATRREGRFIGDTAWSGRDKMIITLQTGKETGYIVVGSVKNV